LYIASKHFSLLSPLSHLVPATIFSNVHTTINHNTATNHLFFEDLNYGSALVGEKVGVGTAVSRVGL